MTEKYAKLILTGKAKGNRQEAIQAGIRALDRRVPIAPTGIRKCMCPRCEMYNDVFKRRRKTVTTDIVYCWHCGQAITL